MVKTLWLIAPVVKQFASDEDRPPMARAIRKPRIVPAILARFVALPAPAIPRSSWPGSASRALFQPPIPHPFSFSQEEKGKLEPPLSTGGEGRG